MEEAFELLNTAERRKGKQKIIAKLFPSLFTLTATYGAFDIILSDATLHNREYVFAIYILPPPPTREREK